MKTPIYRVGQSVQAPSSLLCANEDNGILSQGRILYPVEDGSYLVRLRNGGYTAADESEIVAYPEYDSAKPVERKGIRIVFFGNGQFALPTLKMLVERGYDVAAVVTMEDKPCGRGKVVRKSAVKVYAESMGILVFQPRKLDSNRFLRHIHNLHATLGVVVEFRILPRALYTIPSWGTINLHSSMLPMYRGASTIASAIKDGNSMTGVTTFMLEDKIDTGGIINNLAISIDEDDNAEDVHIKLRIAGAEMMDDAIQRIAHSCRPIPQSELICDFIQPCYAPKLRRKDCIIPWLKPADYVHDFIRALTPIPSAWTSLAMLGKQAMSVKIFITEKTVIPRGHHAPGELFWQDRKLYIACGDNLLSVLELQMPNKRRMTAIEFFNGYRGACKGFCDLGLSMAVENPDSAKAINPADMTGTNGVTAEIKQQ
ncbi:methionyl-tRNA formyltransferase [Muribaculaceae bacterium Isolate-036 (Harlan)]|nr:methionyl-tRNA formyltransferase [Muribaculaceae bacterium Isolate-036 (Harlan)]